MKTDKSEDILSELRKKVYHPIYLLQGDEPFFIDEVTDYIEHHILNDFEKSFNQTVVYGKDVDADTIVTTARRYPMMAEQQVVIVKEAQSLKDIGQLLNYAEKPAYSTLLVLVHKYKLVAANTKVFKAIEKNGVVLNTAKLYENHVPGWIQRYVKGKSYLIESQAVDTLVAYLGTELSRIANELNKLMVSLPTGSNITAQQVADNIGINKDYNVFEFQKALAHKNITKVFAIAEYFANNQKTNPLIVTLGSLYRFYSKLYLYLQTQNKPEQEILATLELRNSYALQDYKEAAKHYKLHQIKNIIGLLHLYDLKAKGVDNLAPPEALLKELTFRLIVGD